MSYFNTVLNFLNHRLHSRKWDSFHSPYLYKLFTTCCENDNGWADFEIIEKKRNELIQSNVSIKRIDYGAGIGRSALSGEIPVSAIARKSLSLPFQCRFLYHLMKMIRPRVILELGTSLGITTSYLAKGAGESQIISVEGDPAVVSIAQNVIDTLYIKSISLINSTFEKFISDELQKMSSLDFIFLDGNHRAEPLLYYYQSLRPKFNANTIVMVDDIYWSSDMQSGWSALIDMPEVTQSVDCFQFGLLFFNPDFISKENHRIRLPLKAFQLILHLLPV